MKIRYFVVLALLLTAILGFSGTAKALTVGELQVQIKALMTQIAQLQEQLKQQQNQGTGTWCYNFNKNLRIGDNGYEDLNALFSIFGREGFFLRSDFIEYGFDEIVASTVSEFQEKYADEVLRPSGLKRGTGYVGPSTRRKLNALYGCNSVVPPALTCKNLWWHDNTTTTCQQQQFCGAFMYFGLQTFKEKEDCLKSLNVANQGIILPIASAVWQVGGSYDVIWNSSVFGDKVSIALTNVDNNKVCDFDGITNTGNYRFTVPVKTGFGSCDDGSNLPGRYQITVWTKAVTLKSEIFSVVASATQPSITVTSPNGGEVWKVGETQTIKYIASNIPKTATCIDAFAVDSVGKEAPLFLGSYIFMITDSTLTFKLGVGDSNNIIPGDYKIKLDVHACAETNNTPITSGTSLGFIKIVTNSEFIKPSLSQITPSQGNKNNTVTIYGSNLSDVSGIMMTPAGRSLGYTACTNIISKSQNSITFNFTSGFCDLSGLYKVSVISSTGQSNLLDFEFVSVSAQSSITVTSPNGGETWAKGSTQTITWNPVGLSNDSKVAISLTIGGANPIFFASNIPSNSGTYSWTIPNALLAGSQCKIGISDSTPGITKPNIAEDLSDNYFTISTATTIPFISSIFPTSGYNGIELYGSRFTSDTRIRFVKNGFVYIVDSDKISFDLSSHVLPNRIRWTFDGMLGEGLYEISLINSNGISNSVNFNLTSSDQLLHPSLYVKRLFPGQYDNTKYEVRISGISLSGLSDVAVNKAGGGKLMVGSPRDGTAPCSSSTSTVTVTLLPSDFPLTGTVVECKSSTVYPVKAQMPSL